MPLIKMMEYGPSVIQIKLASSHHLHLVSFEGQGNGQSFVNKVISPPHLQNESMNSLISLV
jgi:hypothetical protein